MKKTACFLLIVYAATFTADPAAADWKAIEGTYAVTAENYLDPSEEEAKDSHIRFQLTGDAARDLYLSMKAAEAIDECTGALAKKVGEMQCLLYENEKKYECHFSIDIMRQAIEYGVAC